MGEQLTHIALLRIRKPQPGKTVFHQQLENMAGVSLVGLLLANITGSNLGRIPNPQGVSKLFHQQLKPARIAGGFHANQRRNRQLTIESFRLAAGMHQLLLLHLPGLCVQYCYLLVARVKITAYNLHKAPLLPRSATQVSNPSLVPGPLGPFGLSNQPKGRDLQCAIRMPHIHRWTSTLALSVILRLRSIEALPQIFRKRERRMSTVTAAKRKRALVERNGAHAASTIALPLGNSPLLFNHPPLFVIPTGGKGSAVRH